MTGTTWKGRDQQGQIMWHVAGHAKGVGNVLKPGQFFFFKDVKAFASHSKILAWQSSKVYFHIKSVKVIAVILHVSLSPSLSRTLPYILTTCT